MSLLSSDLDYLLSLHFDLPQLLHQYWNLNDFLHNVLNVSVYSDNFWNYSFHFDNLRHINSLFYYLLHFINLWNLSNSIDDLLNYLLHFFYLLDYSFNRHNLLPPSLNFNNSVLNVRDNLLYLFDSFLNYDIINKFLHLNDLDYLMFNRHDPVSDFINLLNLSMNDFNRDHLFNNTVDWNLYFYRNNDFPIDFDYLWLFNDISDNFFDFQCSRNLSVLNNDSFGNHLLDFSVLFVDLITHQDLPHHIDRPFDFQINVSRRINFHNSLLNDRYMDNSFDFYNLGYGDNLFNYFLHNLRHFDYLLYDSRHNNNPFHNSLNLNYFWNLNELFNYLLNYGGDCFNSFDYFLNWDDSFLNDSDYLRFPNKVVDDLLHFFDSVLI